MKLPDDVNFDRPGNPLDHHPTWKNVALPAMRQGRRGARPTPWTRSSIRPGTSRASPIRGSRPRRPTARSSTPGCRSTSTSAASSTRSCTCSTARFFTRAMKATGHAGLDEPFAGLFTQGMVVHETYQSPNGEWVTPAEVKIEGAGDSRRATLIATGEPIEIGADREDVEVEDEHRRSRRHHRHLRRRHRALVHAVGFAARARRDLDRGGRAGRRAFRAAALAAGRRGGGDRRRRPARRGRPHSASRRWRCARPRIGHWPTSRRTSSGCASTSASPTSTSSPTPSRRRSASMRLSQRPTSAGRCARRPKSWCGCSTR